MKRYPLLFTFHDKVSGNGFLADVEARGKALMVDEGDGFWMYGVNPGGLAEGGESMPDAYWKFREDYRKVLYDIAHEAATFADFRREVEKVFNDTNNPVLQEWDEAVTDVRAGRVNAPLPKQPAESERLIRVTQKLKQLPSDNIPDSPIMVAA